MKGQAMHYFWGGIAVVVLVLIVGGIISSMMSKRRMRMASEKILPKVVDHIRADRRYNIFLSHGKMLQNVRFIGISPSDDYANPYLPFPLCAWLIVEMHDGRRAYIKPVTVRYYEDADEQE